MASKFAGKVVLVTGASKGIGAEIAKQFASEGAVLSLTGRDTAALSQVANECRTKQSNEVLEIVADLCDEEQAANVVQQTVDKLGKLDVLVNNAGICLVGKIEEATLKDFDRLFTINVRSMFHLTQLAVPHLKKVKGNIVNISSICSTGQYTRLLLYNMTKAAVDQFTKTTALELAPSGVRVNAANPASVKTTIYANAYTPEGLEEYYEKAKSFHPLGRNVEAKDVADAVLYLASDSAKMVTGTCLMVDGGRLLNST
ncbi:putative oxidoreductase MexAM1_META1p0182 [Ciona intestinalis]